MIRRTLKEWDSLPYGDGPGAIPVAAADRLAAVAAASALAGQGSGVLEHGRKALRARGVVGVVAAPGAELEILPKIDSADESEAGIRYRLVHMLAVALDLSVADGELAQLGTQRDTLLEVLVGLFSRRLADQVRRGLPRSYVGCADDLPALRGRLDVVRQFTTLAASPQKLACRFDALSPNTPLNQVMKAAVLRLGFVSRSAVNQARLRELALAYADVGMVPVPALSWDRVVVDRTNAPWQALLRLAVSTPKVTDRAGVDGWASFVGHHAMVADAASMRTGWG